ncbi:MAG: HAD family hydrolase [bacterium]
MASIYKAVLFDMDGVLVDSMPYHYRAWREVFRSLGISLDKMEIYKREGEQGIRSIAAILAEHGIQLSPEQMDQLLQKKEAIFKGMAAHRLFPGVESLVRELRGEGYLIGLVTGTSRGEIDYVLPGNLIHSFDVVVTGDSVEHGKPAPDPYLKAIEGLHIDPSDALVIENAPYGIQSAKKAGIFCIALTTSLPRKYLRDADMVCDSLEEVRGLLRGKGLGLKVAE